MRSLLIVVIALLPTSPVMARTVHCSDAKSEVAVEYDVAFDDKANTDTVTRVQMQIAGDFGISTDPAHPDYSGEAIAEQYFGNDVMMVNLRAPDEGTPALELRLGTAYLARQAITAGVLGVNGGGLWAVVCSDAE
jgi:hypothetical protein